MSKDQYWFAFKQTKPPPPGGAIACGPYPTYEKAKIEMEKAKAWDCEVSTPYAAASKEEAEDMAKKRLA